jgi:hypothetical protein
METEASLCRICLPPACSLVSWTYYFDPEDGGDKFLRNVGWNSRDYTASYPRRWYSWSFITVLTRFRHWYLFWFSPRHHNLFLWDLFNIILPSTSRFSQLSPSFWLSHQNPVYIHLLPIRATCPTHLILSNFIILLKFYEYKLWRGLHQYLKNRCSRICNKTICWLQTKIRNFVQTLYSLDSESVIKWQT